MSRVRRPRRARRFKSVVLAAATQLVACAQRGDVPKQAPLASSATPASPASSTPGAIGSGQVPGTAELEKLAPGGFLLVTAEQVRAPAQRTLPVGGEDGCFRIAARSSENARFVLLDAPMTPEFWPRATSQVSDVFCRSKQSEVVLRLEGTGAGSFALFRAMPAK